MRVYVPATVAMLRTLVADGEFHPVSRTAFSVTPTLREAYSSGDDEELAEVAMNEAANARSAAADRTLATAQEGYRLARIAYEAGKSPLIELIASRRALAVARGVVLDARASQFDARANLARLQGQTITGDIIQ